MKTKKLQKPLIGISTNQYILENSPFAGQKRIYINRDYTECVLKAGGIPFLLPLNTPLEAIEQQIMAMDGIVFSGGQDVHPLRYGEEPSRFLEAVCSERDEYELEALKLAYALKKPILGICRGLQLINIAFGGTLYQDIGHQIPHQSIQHFQKAHKAVATHSVELVPKTLLASIFETNHLITNSFHHQAIKDLAHGFKVNAMTRDGVIEGIEREDSSFLVGVQWHPEMMIEKHPEMLKLFAAFVSSIEEQSGSE